MKRRILDVVTGRRSGRVLVAVAILLSALALTLGGSPQAGDDATGSPPGDAESMRAADLVELLPASDTQTALVVFARADGAVGEQDLSVIRAARDAFAGTAVGGRVPPSVVSEDGSTALIPVPLPGDLSEEETPAVVETLREQGQELLARSFAAGAAQPTIIVGAADRAGDIVAATAQVSGAADAEIGDRNDELARIDVTLTSGPGSDESLATIQALRSAVGDVEGAEALVGGPEALALDTREAAARDRAVVIPLVLAVVLVVLPLLLRSVVAAVLLVLTVVATYVASLGASWVVLSRLTDFPAFDLQVPLLGFLFLVALGVDYNIFLTTRAREETPALGAREGIVVALAVTGGVITSAGILLAAVFTVLGVLPLVTLTQLGVVVGLGVLLDALLVRSVVVPALVSLTGRFFWWPSRLSRPEQPRHAGTRHPVVVSRT